jgi:hypothetical protein
MNNNNYMKYILIILLITLFSGCYTQLAVKEYRRQADRTEYYNDTKYDEEDTNSEFSEYVEDEAGVINNYYIGGSYYSPYRRFFMHHYPSVYVGYNYGYYDSYCWDPFWSWNWCYTPYITYGFYVPFYSYYDYHPYWWGGSYSYSPTTKTRTRSLANLRNNEGIRNRPSTSYGSRDVINSSLNRGRPSTSIRRDDERQNTLRDRGVITRTPSEKRTDVSRETRERDRRQINEERKTSNNEGRIKEVVPSKRKDVEVRKETIKKSPATRQRENVKENDSNKRKPTIETPKQEPRKSNEGRSYSAPSRNEGRSSSSSTPSRSSDRGGSNNSGSSNSGRRSR